MEKRLTGLVIMDGFGEPKDFSRSGIVKDNTKFLQTLRDKYPSALLDASGEAIGLPKGQSGTSEVGHKVIGSGRKIVQPITKIDNEIANGKFFENQVLLDAMNYAKENNKALHLLGIATDGGIHSHINHLFALLDMAKKENVEKVYLHLFTDGRDVPPKSAISYLHQVEEYMSNSCGKIATLVGRYYALDRDDNWDRIEVAYNAMLKSEGDLSEDIEKSIEKQYNEGVTDEFLKPIIVAENGQPVAKIEKGDSVIIYNFRADRERRLAEVLSSHSKIEYAEKLDLHLVCMCEYQENMQGVSIAYPPEVYENILSEVLSNRGYKQFKCAETEKYMYITYVFNANKETPYSEEKRTLIASPKMPTYVSKPEMSAREVTEKSLKFLQENEVDVFIINLANPDMVGHSGDIEATKQAIAVVDECVEKLVNYTLGVNGRVIITADHGNADIMKYEDGSPHTAHTSAQVPFIVVDDNLIGREIKTGGTIADVAPTLLTLLGEEIPEEMTGENLLKWFYY